MTGCTESFAKVPAAMPLHSRPAHPAPHATSAPTVASEPSHPNRRITNRRNTNRRIRTVAASQQEGAEGRPGLTQRTSPARLAKGASWEGRMRTSGVTGSA
eukprot:2221728-Rhodomonas_salina.1